MSVIHFKFCKLNESWCKCGRFDAGASQICKQLASSVLTPGANLHPSQIPSGKRSPWLFWPPHPFLQFVARRFVLGAIQLIQFFEEKREIRVRRVTIDESFDEVISN